jgi:hypothetical protein
MKIEITVNPEHCFKTLVVNILEGIRCQVDVFHALSGSEYNFDEFCEYVKKKIMVVTEEIGHIFYRSPGLGFASGQLFVSRPAGGKSMRIYAECKSDFRGREPFEIFSFTITE